MLSAKIGTHEKASLYVPIFLSYYIILFNTYKDQLNYYN
jgi:hypothetical protein